MHVWPDCTPLEGHLRISSGAEHVCSSHTLPTVEEKGDKHRPTHSPTTSAAANPSTRRLLAERHSAGANCRRSPPHASFFQDYAPPRHRRANKATWRRAHTPGHMKAHTGIRSALAEHTRAQKQRTGLGARVVRRAPAALSLPRTAAANAHTAGGGERGNYGHVGGRSRRNAESKSGRRRLRPLHRKGVAVESIRPKMRVPLRFPHDTNSQQTTTLRPAATSPARVWDAPPPAKGK